MSGNLRIYTLCSGSSGNSLFIDCDGEKILIDAGISAKALDNALSELNTSMSNISHIFVTHEHGDHIKGIEVVSTKYNSRIHMTELSYKNSAFKKADTSKFMLHEPCYEFELQKMKLHSFVTPHDSAMSVGYIIDTNYGKIALATDMGYMTRGVYSEIKDCDFVILESNYDEIMLKNGPYPQYLKKRIYSDKGHLSNDACAETVLHLADERPKIITLAHLSKENNTPDAALFCSEKILTDNGKEGITLSVAKRSEITEIYNA